MTNTTSACPQNRLIDVDRGPAHLTGRMGQLTKRSTDIGAAPQASRLLEKADRHSRTGCAERAAARTPNRSQKRARQSAGRANVKTACVIARGTRVAVSTNGSDFKFRVLKRLRRGLFVGPSFPGVKVRLQ